MQDNKLYNIVESAVQAVDYQLWGIEFVASKHSGILRVFIDSPDGIGLDDCEKASRQISAVLDVHDPIEGNYNLEVSSPGLERPLFELTQFKLYENHTIKLVLHAAVKEKRRFKAVLNIVDQIENIIRVTTLDGEELTIDKANIAKANLVFEG
jgi:ribosome maturation factor RimP